MLQAIGRARGVRRGPDRPVRVTVLAALALPVTVREVAAWEGMQPDRLDVAAAEAALNGRALPLAPADLHAARPDLWSTPKAAKRELEKRRGEIVTAGESPSDLIENSYKALRAFIQRNDFALTPARYRKGRGRWSLALVAQEGGRAALEALVGPVVAYEGEEAPPLPPEPAMPESPPAPADQPGLHPSAFGLRRARATDEPASALALLEPQEAPPAPLSPAAALAPALRSRLRTASAVLDVCRPPKLWGDETDRVRVLVWRERCASARERVAPAPIIPAGALPRGEGGVGLSPSMLASVGAARGRVP